MKKFDRAFIGIHPNNYESFYEPPEGFNFIKEIGKELEERRKDEDCLIASIYAVEDNEGGWKNRTFFFIREEDNQLVARGTCKKERYWRLRVAAEFGELGRYRVIDMNNIRNRVRRIKMEAEELRELVASAQKRLNPCSQERMR